MLTPGQRLRALREEFGLTIRDVETASIRIAAKHQNDDFIIPLSRLSDIETKGIVPSIFRLYSLAVIYRRDMREFLAWFGVDLNGISSDLCLVEPPRSHRSEALDPATMVRVPMKLDPAFDGRKTTNIGRMIEQWGTVPLAYLQDFTATEFSYGYVGTEDFTMYPILLPGSFVQIDETKNEVMNGVWRSEYERPIYFVETREGYTCSWCALKKDQLILQPHPLSPAPVRILQHPRDAEVVGQVVGVAMKLGDWRPCKTVPEPKVPAELC
ncbi:MAG TPA: helix-turn-helix transcriptional regulator [Terriglobales bacterium]|nr:helix-turn-helix transcriptional regulator [Terriglobales bacterium]